MSLQYIKIFKLFSTTQSAKIKFFKINMARRSRFFVNFYYYLCQYTTQLFPKAMALRIMSVNQQNFRIPQQVEYIFVRNVNISIRSSQNKDDTIHFQYYVSSLRLFICHNGMPSLKTRCLNLCTRIQVFEVVNNHVVVLRVMGQSSLVGRY